MPSETRRCTDYELWTTTTPALSVVGAHLLRHQQWISVGVFSNNNHRPSHYCGCFLQMSCRSSGSTQGDKALLPQGVVQEVTHPESLGFYARLFPIPKPGGKWRHFCCCLFGLLSAVSWFFFFCWFVSFCERPFFSHTLLLALLWSFPTIWGGCLFPLLDLYSHIVMTSGTVKEEMQFWA